MLRFQCMLQRLTIYQHQQKRLQDIKNMTEQSTGYVKFEIGVPQTVVLASLDPIPCRGFKNELQHMYKLAGGKVMYVPPGLSTQFLARGLKPGQPVEIVKGRAPDGRNTEWKVSIPGESRTVKARFNGQDISVILDHSGDVCDVTESQQKAQVPLPDALKMAIKAAKEAEAFGDTMGYPFRFQSADVLKIALEMSR